MNRNLQRHPSKPVFSDTPTYGKSSGYLRDSFRTDVLQATDWLDHTFEVGDKVMYCIGAGRGQMMAIGTVLTMRAIPRRDLVSWDWEEDAEGRRPRRINEVWEDSWEVEVQVLTERTSGAWDNEKRTRPAWVNPMNITAMKAVSE